MMLAEFQSLYPTGSLISELVQIYHGKYIVRASVQIDGVTRATGMAAAETVEAAEDQARNRALMVLKTTAAQPKDAIAVSPISQVQSNNSLPAVDGLGHESTPASVNLFSQAQTVSPTTSNPVSPEKTLQPNFPVTNNLQPQWETTPELSQLQSSNELEPQPLPEISSSKVTPFPQPSYSHSSEDGTMSSTITKKKKKSEPVDQSDDIAKIGVEMERLGWTTEQGRDYLIKTYGKRSRHLLNADELRDFLKYLESQPTPPDPLVQF
jgi:hypothetical protein